MKDYQEDPEEDEVEEGEAGGDSLADEGDPVIKDPIIRKP